MWEFASPGRSPIGKGTSNPSPPGPKNCSLIPTVQVNLNLGNTFQKRTHRQNPNSILTSHLVCVDICIPFNCCKCTVFKLWKSHKTRTFRAKVPSGEEWGETAVSQVSFSQQEMHLLGRSPFGPQFYRPKWEIFLSFHILILCSETSTLSSRPIILYS